MEPDKKKSPMHAVLESMGRAARDARARRFTAKRPAKDVEMTMGEVTMDPGNKMGPPGAKTDMEVDPVKDDISDTDMAEMLEGLQR